MVTPVIVVLDEARDLGFEIIRQVMVLEQNAVLKRLVPALDLCDGVVRRVGSSTEIRRCARSAQRAYRSCDSYRNLHGLERDLEHNNYR